MESHCALLARYGFILFDALGKRLTAWYQFPVAVARSPGKHSQVCVANGGKVNGVACFHVDNERGLTPMGNTVRPLGLNQTTPATGPPGTVSDILFSEDGKKLLVSVKGVPPIPGFIAQWDVAADGSLSKNFTALTATAGGLVSGLPEFSDSLFMIYINVWCSRSVCHSSLDKMLCSSQTQPLEPQHSL